MNIEQINQETAEMPLNSDGIPKEIKLAEGIYFTDYRKKPTAETGSNQCANYFATTR